MKKKTNILIFPLLIIGVFLVFASSCEKDDNNGSSSNNPTNGKTTAVFNSAVTYGTMTDQDGNVYKTVTIGTQTWMAENLRTTKYNDGTAVSNATTEWASLTTGAYCNYNNTTDIDTIATYGRLYNWYAVNTSKLAPRGWHVPSDAEWSTLTYYLGGESVAGDKLKETGATHWIRPHTGVTNETGFTALPGGYRLFSNGAYLYIGEVGNWWSSTESSTSNAWMRYVEKTSGDVVSLRFVKEFGFSVRCVKD